MPEEVSQPGDYTLIAARFNKTVQKYFAIVESSAELENRQFLFRLYQILPDLISQAIRLPDIELADDEDPDRPGTRRTHEEWKKLYEQMKTKLGESDLYWQVFDPTKDTEVIRGTLADDISDIYGDLRLGAMHLKDSAGACREAIWIWRLQFLSHWGKHAIDALRTIHFLGADFPVMPDALDT